MSKHVIELLAESRGVTVEQACARLETIPPEAWAEHFDRQARFIAAVRSHFARQEAWLQKVPAAERAVALNREIDRWDRELLADLAPIVGDTIAWTFTRDVHTARLAFLSKGGETSAAPPPRAARGTPDKHVVQGIVPSPPYVVEKTLTRDANGLLTHVREVHTPVAATAAAAASVDVSR